MLLKSREALCLVVSVVEERYPSIYTRAKAVMEAILGAKQELHHLSMEACLRQSEERQGGTRRGSPAPLGRPPLDQCLRVVGFEMDLDHIAVVLCSI